MQNAADGLSNGTYFVYDPEILYTGAYIDDCASSPCQHGGICDGSDTDAYVCDCTGLGWTGNNCEKKIDDPDLNAASTALPWRISYAFVFTAAIIVQTM